MRTEKKSVLKFYIRRYFIIAPLYYVGIIIYFVSSIITNYYKSGSANPDLQYTIKNVLSNITFTHSFYPPAFNNIVPGGWSIGTEMAFYLIFPLLFFVYERFKNKNAFIVMIPLGVVLSSFLFLHISPYFINLGQTDYFYYFNLINQISVFTLGMSLFFYSGNLKFDKISAILLLILFIVLTIVLAYNEIDDFAIRPFVSGLSFILLFMAFKNMPFIGGALLRKIGQVSFSIYILHFLFVWNLSRHIAHFLQGYGWNGVLILIVCVFVSLIFSIILAMLTEKYIEKPGINLGKRIIEKIEQPLSVKG
jgi:peptidoglycan/LPS O-acetylase OafA/YrhL